MPSSVLCSVNRIGSSHSRANPCIRGPWAADHSHYCYEHVDMMTGFEMFRTVESVRECRVGMCAWPKANPRGRQALGHSGDGDGGRECCLICSDQYINQAVSSPSPRLLVLNIVYCSLSLEARFVGPTLTARQEAWSCADSRGPRAQSEAPKRGQSALQSGVCITTSRGGEPGATAGACWIS